MRAGLLRHRITIQRRVEAQGTTGEVSWTWADVATVWASVEPIAGREYFAADQVQSDVTHRLRLRYMSGVDQKMRVFYDGRYFAIESVIDWQERRTEMHLMAVERNAEGWADGP